MKKKTRYFIPLGLVLIVLPFAACTTLPDARIRYYLPQSNVSLSVVRTMACTDTNNLVTSYAVTPKVTHTADLDKEYEIDLTELRGIFSDSDVKVELHSDGRLKSIGATSTGQGEGILKTAITIVDAAFGLHGLDEDHTETCKIINENSGDDPLTITYAGSLDLSNTSTEQELIAAPGSRTIAEALKQEIGGICASVESKSTGRVDPIDYTKKDNEEVITLLSPGSAKLIVKAGGANHCNDEEIWSGNVVVAQAGKPYDIPLPSAGLFGKRSVSVVINEAGSLSTVGFTGSSGLGQGLNVANSAYEATQGESTAEKAAAVKAEADLIAQQQRLVACIADKANCK